MDTKKFKANTMIEALQMVQTTLGPDAVVLSAREVTTGPLWNKRNAIELVAAPPQNVSKNQVSTGQKPSLSLADNDSQIEWVKDDPMQARVSKAAPETKSKFWQPAHMSREEAKVAAQPQQAAVPVKNIERPVPAAQTVPMETLEREAPLALEDLPKGLKKNRQTLLAQGVEEGFLDRTIKLLTSTINPLTLQDEDTSRKYLLQIMEAELRTLPNLSMQPPAQTLCLVGPSGSGKTNSAAKLAVFYGQQMGNRVTWICADTIRTGAITQGRTYAEALGLRFKLAYTPNELKDCVLSEKDADLILIDTPGYNFFNEGEMVELGSLLTEIPNRQTFLTVPATGKENDLVHCAAALGLFGVDGMIVTKLDETNTYGSIFNIARKTHIPVGFFSAGKEATDKFQVASASRLVSALFGKGWLK